MKSNLGIDMEYTLQEIADEMGTTRQVVDRIEKRALAKLKKALMEKGLGPSMLDELPEGPGLFDVKSVL